RLGAARAREQVHAQRDHGKQTALALDAHVDPPPRSAARREPLQDARVDIFRKTRAGVKKEQDFVLRERRSRVHLARASARSRNDPVGGAARESRSLVARAAVDDDYFVAALA